MQTMISNEKNSTKPKPSSGRDVVLHLRAMALKALERMYIPEERLFAFCLRKKGKHIALEGKSPRYTAISVIGLSGESENTARSVLSGHSLQEVCTHLAQNIHSVENLGDVALTLWAAGAAGVSDRRMIWERLDQLQPAEQKHPTLEVAWALVALCRNPDIPAGDLGGRLARRLISGFSKNAGVFPNNLGGSGGFRSHVACFADMVYPIEALSVYSQLSGEVKALDAANRAAETICGLQGPAGQWWWHYDCRTGRIIEEYPVYAIHQDAMAPMALLALKEAGGMDFTDKIQKGLDWLCHAPEIRDSLIDDNAGIIWRKVARKEPKKFFRYVQGMVSRVHPSLRIPGLDKISKPTVVDYESRPYHMGWILYAWNRERLQHLEKNRW